MEEWAWLFIRVVAQIAKDCRQAADGGSKWVSSPEGDVEERQRAGSYGVLEAGLSGHGVVQSSGMCERSMLSDAMKALQGLGVWTLGKSGRQDVNANFDR